MKRTVAAGATVLATLTLTACGTQDPFGEETPAPSSAAEPGTVVIGTANFPESEIIGQIWAEALRKEGFDVEVSSGIGSREVYLGALQEGSVNVVPEYSGNLTQFYGGGELADALPEDLVAGELSPAESKDAYRVTRDLADEQGLVTIADLDKLDTITIAAPPEFAQRPYGPEGLTTVYGIDAGKIKVNPISDGGGPLTVQALVEGAANVANIFTTSPALLKNGEEADLVILEDPENLIPPQNIVPVIKAGSLPDGALDVINSVDAQLTTEDVVAMNMRNVGPERAEPTTIAKDFVASLD
ncbi:glycine betaine ABC transporter substrate-binding protein [Corynebacterium qintianiae]|uniref:glycine betaine ABC transporter substrate-binding protein n=1 Tax=Corynebacterium qintianiae TaxID=2709392 RepID=UPI0013EBF8B5|nr:ABC transporter substrate-binding protein [Corynebacterium qintianiae]